MSSLVASKIDLIKETQASELRGSFLLFTEFFFKHLTGRDFIISKPIGRESHHVTISKALTQAFRLASHYDRLIINVPPGYSKPLCKKTKLLTINGEQKCLGSIQVGDKVLTHLGRFRKVTNLFQQGELPTFKIKTFSGREIITAYDHTFLTANGWKHARDLQIDDCLGIAIPQVDFGQSFSQEGSRLLGYFIGDGSINHNNSSITASDPIIKSDILSCCDKLGFKSSIVSYDLKNKPLHYNQNLVRINISGGSRNWLKREGIAGLTSYTKRVPKSIMLGDFETIKHFLGAYFACDGTFGSKAKGRRDFSGNISSVSKGLLEDCQHLFVRLGIRTRVRTRIAKIKTKKQGDTYTSYCLEFSSQDDMYNFQQLIGNKIHHIKAEKLMGHSFLRSRFDSIIQPDHIISIEENGLVDCMCIEVDEDHTFAANDIIVHNSVMVSMWVAWTLAHYPDSQYLYISYTHDLAAKHTAFIKTIVGSAMYRYLFDISINPESRAKDFFKTMQGGSIRAFGSGGAVVGQDAGLPGLDRFSGACLIDDPIKPDDGHSQAVRDSVTRNYEETIRQRTRGILVPIIFIGQRIHEDDLAAFLLSGKDTHVWKPVVLQALDDAGNALYPEKDPKSHLLQLQEKSPYVFASQFQQNPIPAGGSLFKPEWFPLLEEEPIFLTTFMTCDTAETSKHHNDSTAFSFWGLYEIESLGVKTGELGLHWIDAVEIWVEPKDLKDEFLMFWQACCRHKMPPMMAAIEKKSTGVTLVSVLQELRGMLIRDIERTSASGSKAQRFLEIQPYVASKRISLPKDGKHAPVCLTHMSKITANDSHARDDLGDTCADAVRMALIDKSLIYNTRQRDDVAAKISGTFKKDLRLKGLLYGNQQGIF